MQIIDYIVDESHHIALSETGGEPPKRRQWRMKRGGEVKKQGAMRSASSKQGDYVSEGAGGEAQPRRVWRYNRSVAT